MARRPGTTPRAADHTASSSERNVASAAAVSDTAGSRSPKANAAAIASTVPDAIRKAGCMPSIFPSIRNTMAPTHI